MIAEDEGAERLVGETEGEERENETGEELK
jgi:hypothetical protein